MFIRCSQFALVLLVLGACDDARAPGAARAKRAPVRTRELPVEPPYDLASDVAARTRDARAWFGAATRVRIEGEAFVLVDADHGALFGSGDALVRRVIRSFQSGPMPVLPDHAVTVDIFSSHAAYVAYSNKRYGIDPEPRYAGDRTLFGYYRPQTREILVDGTSGWGTLVHEVTHPFVRRNWGADREPPAWLSEGIASYFEAYSFAPDGSIHGVTNWRYDVLRTAFASPDLAPSMHLQTLLASTDDDFESTDGETQGRWYALARFVCQWLDSAEGGRKLWQLFALLRDTQDDEPTGLAAFTRAVGLAPADADARWLAYVRHLRYSA